MPLHDGHYLDAARRSAGLGVDELWMDYIALGGLGTRSELQAVLDDISAIGPNDHDVLVQAINERFMERGGYQPIAYAADLDQNSAHPRPDGKALSTGQASRGSSEDSRG